MNLLHGRPREQGANNCFELLLDEHKLLNGCHFAFLRVNISENVITPRKHLSIFPHVD